ncbi:hypothetical protein HZS_1659 [Henneguya salminicola]|nr:hypothetical protein HZS_1659 [Henneguya salminicola]
MDLLNLSIAFAPSLLDFEQSDFFNKRDKFWKHIRIINFIALNLELFMKPPLKCQAGYASNKLSYITEEKRELSRKKNLPNDTNTFYLEDEINRFIFFVGNKPNSREVRIEY